MMKWVALAISLSMAGCSMTPTAPHVQERLSSWQGARATDLSGVLGDPAGIKQGLWVWRFTAHARPVANGANKIGAAPAKACFGCSPSGSLTLGYHDADAVHTQTRSGAIDAIDCRYIALVHNGVVVNLEVQTAAGRCRFDELPLNRS